MDTQTTVPVTLTNAEATVLHQARHVLKAIAERVWAESWNLNGREAGARGRVAAEAEAAEETIFDVLNSLSAYMDDEQAKAAIQAYYVGPAPTPEQVAELGRDVWADARSRIVEALAEETTGLGAADICQRTGLQFLAVAGTNAPGGESLLDRMADRGEIIRDSSSGVHRYSLPS